MNRGVGDYGDNLSKLGGNLEKEAGCCEKEKERLKELGKHINYNAHGESIEDLHFSPPRIYQEVKNFIDPLIFINRLNYLKV